MVHGLWVETVKDITISAVTVIIPITTFGVQGKNIEFGKREGKLEGEGEKIKANKKRWVLWESHQWIAVGTRTLLSKSINAMKEVDYISIYD